MKKTFLKPILFTLLSMAFIPAVAQSVSFNVTTSSPAANSNNDNIFAIWVTNSSGTYITTINRQGIKYIADFTYWKVIATGGTSNTDGVTGATLTSHNQATNPTGGATRRPFTWDCKDRNGNLVPDGNYTISVEFKEENTAVQKTTYTFTKGASSITNQTYPDLTYFKNATLTYTAPTAAVHQAKSELEYSLIKTKDELTITYDAGFGKITAQLFDVKGNICSSKVISAKAGEAVIDIAKLKGIYILKIIDANNKIASKKIIL